MDASEISKETEDDISDSIVIDVGVCLFRTLTSTLLKYPGTRLYGVAERHSRKRKEDKLEPMSFERYSYVYEYIMKSIGQVRRYIGLNSYRYRGVFISYIDLHLIKVSRDEAVRCGRAA